MSVVDAQSDAASPAKKKLLYVTVCDPDLEVTGATVRIGAFVHHLARYYAVTLVNMAGSGHRVDADIAARYRDNDNRLGVTQRTRVPFSQPGYFLFSSALYQAASAYLRSQRFDYILADYGLAAVYGIALTKQYRVPFIYSSHNLEYRMYLDLCRYDWRRALLAPYVYVAERTACRTAHVVVVISEHDAQAYSKWTQPANMVVIPQGFEPSRCHPPTSAPPDVPAVVLFVGSFRDHTNCDAARHVMQHIAPVVLDKRPETIFQFIGADPPDDLAGPNVQCLGFVDDLTPYWQRANVVIAPMRVAHGMSTKIITALAFGKTVITTPQGAGALPTTYRQLLVTPLETFANQLLHTLSHPIPAPASEFTRLEAEFGWPSSMDRLYNHIERSQSVHTRVAQADQ